MDTEWINKQRKELDRLLGKKFSEDSIKYGVQLLSEFSNHGSGTKADICFTILDRTPQDKKVLLEKIKALEEENKELKHQLVMKTLEYKF